MLEQCARALGEAACGETCEIWIWRSAVEGDRHLERIALFGQGLVENPLAVLDTEWSYPREFHIEPEAEPEVEPEAAGRQIVHLAIGPYGFATIVRPTASGIADFDQLLACAAAIGDNIVGFLPREELEFSNQWLLKRNAFDRRAATSLAAVTSLDQLGLLVGELSESLLPIEIMGIYFIDPVSTRLRLVHAVGLNEQERRNAERTASGRHPGEVMRTGKGIDIPDTALLDAHDDHSGHGRPVRSRLFLPVLLEGTAIGAIGFASARKECFGQRHRQALAFLCALAGTTYARLRAELHIIRGSALVEAVTTANERLLRAMDWRHAATAALALVGQKLDADALAVVRLEADERGEQLDFVWQPVFGAPWLNRDRVVRLAGVERTTLSRGDAIKVEIVASQPLATLKPLIVNGELWGVLVYEPRENAIFPLTRGERSALRALANGFVATIDRERMDQESRQREKVDAVNKLASGVANEFNNLLWPMVLYSDMLERVPMLDERSLRMVRDIRRSAGRASELVQQVFTISRSRDSLLQVIDIAELAIEVSASAQGRAFPGVKIVSVIDADAGSVLGDEEAVRQLLTDCVNHALQSIGSNSGELRLELERVELDRGVWIRILIEDNGRANPKTQVSMTAAHRIAAELGGQLVVRALATHQVSREVLLPITLREAPAHHEEVESATQSLQLRSTAELILLVDDDGAVLEVARQILESLGYEVIACATPKQALMSIADTSLPIALLLTDLAMPGMDGLELAREAKKIRPSMPIVCCTGFGDARSERMAKEIGIAAFIRKPIDFEQYAQTIRAAIDASPRA